MRTRVTILNTLKNIIHFLLSFKVQSKDVDLNCVTITFIYDTIYKVLERKKKKQEKLRTNMCIIICGWLQPSS